MRDTGFRPRNVGVGDDGRRLIRAAVTDKCLTTCGLEHGGSGSFFVLSGLRAAGHTSRDYRVFIKIGFEFTQPSTAGHKDFGMFGTDGSSKFCVHGLMQAVVQE